MEVLLKRWDDVGDDAVGKLSGTKSDPIGQAILRHIDLLRSVDRFIDIPVRQYVYDEACSLYTMLLKVFIRVSLNFCASVL